MGKAFVSDQIRLFCLYFSRKNVQNIGWNYVQFLADRTNGRAIATLLRLSSSSVVVVVVVCDVMYCG